MPLDNRKPDAPIDLALLLQDLEFGGTQRYAINLLKHLDRRLFSPQLWMLCYRTDMAQMAEETGVNLQWLSKGWRVGPGSLARLAYRLSKQPPQILYTLTVEPNKWGRLFGGLAKTCVVVSSYRNPQPKQFDGLLGRFSDRIICNAEALKRELCERHGTDPDLVDVVLNAVDFDFFTPDPSHRSPTPLVLYTGRLVERKDVATLIDGFKVATERVPNATLEIVGDGDRKKQLEAQIARLGLESRVRMFPGQKDLRPFLKRAWVYAMTPNREASPNAILEAMASGLPVVSTRVGGIPELVYDGQSGVIVEPRDPEAVGDALATLLSNDELRNRMGSQARRHVIEHHSMEGMVRKTEQALLEAFNVATLRDGA